MAVRKQKFLILLPLIYAVTVDGNKQGVPPVGPHGQPHVETSREHQSHNNIEHKPFAQVLAEKLKNVFHGPSFTPENRPNSFQDAYSNEDHHSQGSYKPWHGDGINPFFGGPGEFMGEGPIGPGFDMPGAYGMFGMPPMQNIFNMHDPRYPNQFEQSGNNQNFNDESHKNSDRYDQGNAVSHNAHDKQNNKPLTSDQLAQKQTSEVLNRDKNPEDSSQITNNLQKNDLKSEEDKNVNKTVGINANKDFLLVDNKGNSVYLLQGNNEASNTMLPNNIQQPNNLVILPQNQNQQNPVYQVLSGQNLGGNIQMIPNKQNVVNNNNVLPSNQNNGDILVYANGQLIKIPGTVLNQVQNNVPSGNNIVIGSDSNTQNVPIPQNTGYNVLNDIPNQANNGQYQIVQTPNSQNNQGQPQYFVLQPNSQNTNQGVNPNVMLNNNQGSYILQPVNQNNAQGSNNNNNNLGNNQPIYLLQPSNQNPSQATNYNGVSNNNAISNQPIYVLQPAVASQSNINSGTANMVNLNQVNPNKAPTYVAMQPNMVPDSQMNVPINSIPLSQNNNLGSIPIMNVVIPSNVLTPYANQPQNIPQAVATIDNVPISAGENNNVALSSMGIHPAIMLSGFKETSSEDEDQLKTNLDNKQENKPVKIDAPKDSKNKADSKEKDNINKKDSSKEENDKKQNVSAKKKDGGNQ